MSKTDTTAPRTPSVAERLAADLGPAPARTRTADGPQPLTVVDADPALAYRVLDLSAPKGSLAILRRKWHAEGWRELSSYRAVHELVANVPNFELWVTPLERHLAATAEARAALLEDPLWCDVQLSLSYIPTDLRHQIEAAQETRRRQRRRAQE